MHALLKHTSLKRQFELRQKAFKPNMHVQEDVELYRVDGYLQGYYEPHPPNATNEVTMKCFETWRWQYTVHENDSNCITIEQPFECGDVDCDPLEQTTWDPGKIYNYLGDEWCEDFLVDKETYRQQSTEEFKNAGVDEDGC